MSQCSLPYGIRLTTTSFTDGIFTGPSEVAHGFLLDLGDLDHSEIACASEPSQWQSIPAVRFHPIPGLFGHEGGRPHPAGVVFFPAIPRDPGATGASLRDKDEVWGLR